MKPRHFFDTEWGRKLLFFWAPFFLSPQDLGFFSSDSEQVQWKHQALRSLLAYSSYAPLFGSAVLTSSFISAARILASKGIPLEWVLHFKSAALIFMGAGLLAWLGYAAAFSRILAGWVLRFFGALNGADTLQWPLSFWLSYYGGILMVWGIFLWAIVGLLSLELPWFYSIAGLGMMVLLGLFLRMELKVAQQRHRRVVHYIDWYRFTRTSLVLFLIMQGLMVFSIFLVKG
jgi:MFS family permease